MIYPFVELLEAENDPPEEGFDIAPVVLQFEAYMRIVVGIAYDKCRQLREQVVGSEAQEGLDRALRIQDRPEKPFYYDYSPVFKTCIDQWYPLLASWCQERGCREILECLSDMEELHRKNARSILARQPKTISLGEYWFNILRMLDALQKAVPDDEILDFLRRAVLAADIYVHIRNRAGHDLTPGQRDILKKLREWLESQGDPVFSKEGSKHSCTLIAPQKWSSQEENVTCSALTDQSLTRAYVPKGLLMRRDLVGEQREAGRELEDTLFIRMPIQNIQKAYFRVSPFFTAENVEKGLKKAGYGMLLNNTPGGTYRYARIRLEEVRSEYLSGSAGSDAHTPFGSAGCFFVDSTVERTPSKLMPIGSKAHLYASRHPEFFRAMDPKKPFPYYQVLSEEDGRRIAQLQTQQSAVHLIFVTGHGGLGKTHLVLHLLRSKYNNTYAPQRMDIRFDQILFLSAKRASMQIAYGNIDANLDHDIEDYEGTIRLLAKLLLKKEELEYCADELDQLANALIGNAKRQLVIFDDLDTLDINEQVKVCQFLDRFKSENHRILITTRVVPPSVSSIISQQTIIALRPLNVERSLEFCQQYIREEGLKVQGDLVSNAKRIHQVTNGVPLNLVLLLHRMQHGYSEELLYEQIERQSEECTRFIFQHILSVLELPAKYTLGVLGRFGKLLHLSVLSADILHLLLPSLSSDEYKRALKDLEYYALIDCSEDQRIYLRIAVNLESSDEIEISSDSLSILESVEKESVKWSHAMGDTRRLLEYLLEIAKAWNQSDDPVKKEWASNCANVVLDSQYREELSEDREIAWKDLRTRPSRSAIDELIMRVENLSSHDPGTENSVRLLLDRYNQVLNVLDNCVSYWEGHQMEIRRAFELCIEDLYDLYSNPNVGEQAVFLLDQPQKRLYQCYNNFLDHAGEIGLSERCKNILNWLDM